MGRRPKNRLEESLRPAMSKGEVMEDDQEWKEMDNFPGYFVSEYGEIYSTKRNQKLRQRENSSGQLLVHLQNEHGESVSKQVDHLVADHFVPGPIRTKYRRIQHIDGDLLNNFADNLAWKDADVRE